MGHGPSTSATTTNNSAVSRRLSARNNSFVDSNPDPDSIIQTEMQESNGLPASSEWKLKTDRGYRKSTASLSKIFQKRRWRKRRGSISASFNMNNNDVRVDLVNVNTATEEELMTLNGVNRALAQNIVNHRDLIGGFRKIEDLALVSGMGASKLSQIRPEICISRKRPGFSLASSKAPSLESIPSTAELNRPPSNMSRCLKLVNVNQASIFDLMIVDGINQATAAKIIEYRDKRGQFRCIEDLRRVGLNRRYLTAIKPYLTTEDDSDKSSTISSSNSPQRPPRRGHVRSISTPFDMEKSSNNGNGTVCNNSIKPCTQIDDAEEDLVAIADLMSLKSKRPTAATLLNSHISSSLYRVATWNLEDMTVDKIKNSGVMEVITRTILENRFSILAVQEVCDEIVLEKICAELNNPSLRLNRDWTGYRGAWKYVMHPTSLHHRNNNFYLGVLYDALRVDSVQLPKGGAFCPIQNGSLWQFGVFRIEAFSTSWVLVNVLSVPLESTSQANGHAGLANQHEITKSVKSLVEETDGAMIVGYFSAQQAQKGLSEIKDLEMVLPGQFNDQLPTNKTALQEQPCSLWVTSSLKSHLNGQYGVVEEGLSHLAIPNGWSWGGKVSKHGPLWCSLLDTTKIHSSDEEVSTEDKDSEDVPAR